MTSMEQYDKRLEANIKAIEGLSAETYPFLSILLNKRQGALKQRLLYTLQRSLEIQNQERGDYGNYRFFQSLSYFSKDGAEMARTEKTWSKSLILLQCLGLLDRLLPTENANTPYQISAINHEEGNKRKPVSFYSVAKYSKRQLNYAEGKAKKWIESKANTASFSKNTVIKVFSQAIANRIYQDERTISRKKKDIQNLIGEIALQLVKEKGYTSRGEVLGTAIKVHAKKQYEAVQSKTASLETFQCLAIQSDIEKKSANEVKRAWDSNSKGILADVNLRHRRPTDNEKETLHLQGNGWIISR